MNVLFVTKGITFGGVPIVTTQLANRMIADGNQVSIFAFDRVHSTEECISKINPAVQLFFGSGVGYSKDNVKKLRHVFENGKYDFVINQWGLHWFNITCIREAAKDLPIKVITVYHNAPDTNGQIQNCEIALAKANSLIYSFYLKFKKKIVTYITSMSMRYVYDHSDYYFVLSKSFIDSFSKFTGVTDPKKLYVQTNPITLSKDVIPSDYSFVTAKDNEILFVGRMDENQKRISRIIDVWSMISKKLPDWSLRIVGDGPDLPLYKQMAKDLSLDRIYFEGFQNPVSYYQKAKLVLLTSEYEGFGLVLVEAMTFGVVPVVLDSYSALHDILTDGYDGMIVPYNRHRCFDKELFGMKICSLCQNDEMWKNMSDNAIFSSQRFSEDNIISQWYDFFQKHK